MKRVIFILLGWLAVFVGWSQSNGLNPCYKIEVRDLTYEVQEKKASVESVLGTIVGAAAGVSTDTNHKDKTASVIGAVKSGISKVRRFNTVDVLMPDEDGFIVTGTINGISTTTQLEEYKHTDSKGKSHTDFATRHVAKVNVTLTLTDTQSGETMTQGFTSSAYCSEFELVSSSEKAIEEAIHNLSDDVMRYYDHQFPLRANIIEGAAEKKDKQREVYMDIGSAAGAYVGQHYNIYLLMEVAGREARKELGRVKITSIMGDDICLCKVEKGGKEVKAAIDAGKMIRAISND